MDALTSFGLFAVTLMLVTYALESAAIGTFSPLPAHAFSARPTASCRALGHLGSSKRSGRPLRPDDGFGR
jgi:hypothetical protein